MSHRDKEPSFGLLIFSISLAIFMSALDGTIVNIALPTISESFHLSSSTVSWVATMYLLVLAGCVLIFGKIADVIGFKRVFISGFILFTLGSLACGILPGLLDSFYLLVGFRAFQAVGGAMITSIAPAMVTAFIPMERKGKAMGIIMTFAALGTAIGPSVGGILTQYLSWEWIFFINIPIGILAVILGSMVIPASVHTSLGTGFDRKGAFLIFFGMALLLFGFSEGTDLGWSSPVIIGSLVIALVSLGLFIWHELGYADPLLDIRLFKDRNFLFLNLIFALVFFSFSGINYLLPFYLEYVSGYIPADAGIILTSLSAAMMISGLVAGMLFNRIGGKKLAIIAAVIITTGYFLITHLRADTPTAFVVLCLVFIGLGLGMMVSPVTNMIMMSTPRKKSGMVSSVTSLARFAPMTIGIAFYNVIFIEGMIAIATHYNVTKSAPVDIQHEVLAAGFDLSFLASFIIGILIFILTLVVRYEVHPDYLDGDMNKEQPIVV